MAAIVARAMPNAHQPWVSAWSVVLCIILASAAEAVWDSTEQKQEATRAFLQQLADLDLWSGTVACGSAGDKPFTVGVGWASRELSAPMRPELRLPVASTSKSMLAAAFYQLQQKGRLDIQDSAAKYLDPKDFNLKDQWCPRVHGSPLDSPCEVVTLRHLLSHSSGLQDALMCAFGREVEDWQRQYCMDRRSLTYGDVFDEVLGQTRAAWALANWTLGIELAGRPGETYQYSNSNFWLLTYILEKVTGSSLGEYLAANIFGPAGLHDTFYDLAAQGDFAVRERAVWNGGYSSTTTLTAAGAGGSSAGASLNATTRISLHGEGQAPFYSGLLSLYVGAGAVMSTAADLHRWYQVLFTQPELIGLTKASQEDLLKPVVTAGGPDDMYAHALHVDPSAATYWHVGNIMRFRSLASIRLNTQQPVSSPVCIIVGNTLGSADPADAAARAALESQCGSLADLETLLAAEVPGVAAMDAAQHQQVLLAHACSIVRDYRGQVHEYVNAVVAGRIWGAYAAN